MTRALNLFHRILVLCTGNICRSPMGEALFRQALGRIGREVEVRSAGLGALVGTPADENARLLMSHRGLDISSHAAKPVTREIVSWADLVLVMDEPQRRYLMVLDPLVAGKIFLIGHWSGIEIPDPYKGSLDDFERALALIEVSVGDWVRRI